MFENVRRVVTVIDADGVSRVESDGPPPQVTRHPTGTVLSAVWTVDSIPVDAMAEGDRTEYAFLSPPQGVMFRRVEVPPDSVRFVDEQGKPRQPSNDEGMHQTPTVDLIQVLEGDLWLLLPSGEEVHLRPSDLVIQRGTIHAWRNRTDHVTRYFAVMISADLPAGQAGDYSHAESSKAPE
jgi:quercetin dioxygenase-like cupin family protein